MEKNMTKKRDLTAESRALTAKYPELRGKELPREVVDMAMKGMSLVEAYEACCQEDLARENQRLKAELAELKQRKSAEMRGPVRGVTGGESPRLMGEDDFLKGFNN